MPLQPILVRLCDTYFSYDLLLWASYFRIYRPLHCSRSQAMEIWKNLTHVFPSKESLTNFMHMMPWSFFKNLIVQAVRTHRRLNAAEWNRCVASIGHQKCRNRDPPNDVRTPILEVNRLILKPGTSVVFAPHKSTHHSTTSRMNHILYTKYSMLSVAVLRVVFCHKLHWFIALWMFSQNVMQAALFCQIRFLFWFWRGFLISWMLFSCFVLTVQCSEKGSPQRGVAAQMGLCAGNWRWQDACCPYGLPQKHNLGDTYNWDY